MHIVAAMLDTISDGLQAKGLIQVASEIDKVADDLEAELTADKDAWAKKKAVLMKRVGDLSKSMISDLAKVAQGTDLTDELGASTKELRKVFDEIHEEEKDLHLRETNLEDDMGVKEAADEVNSDNLLKLEKELKDAEDQVNTAFMYLNKGAMGQADSHALLAARGAQQRVNMLKEKIADLKYGKNRLREWEKPWVRNKNKLREMGHGYPRIRAS